jgi:hypothetical protein
MIAQMDGGAAARAIGRHPDHCSGEQTALSACTPTRVAPAGVFLALAISGEGLHAMRYKMLKATVRDAGRDTRYTTART